MAIGKSFHTSVSSDQQAKAFLFAANEVGPYITDGSILSVTNHLNAILDLDYAGQLNLAGRSLSSGIGIRDATNDYYTYIIGNTQASDITYVLPLSQGGLNTYLRNDGAGNLSWAECSGGIGGDTYKAMVSSGDTTPDFLQEKVVGTTDRVTVVKINTSSDEQLQIDVPNLIYLYPPNADSLQDCVLSGLPATYSGYLSAGNDSYGPLAPAGTLVNNIIRVSDFTLLSPNPDSVFNFADSGAIVAVLNGLETDAFDLSAAFNELSRPGAQTYTPMASPLGIITITSVEWYNSFPLWQKGNAGIDVGSLSLLHGYNSIEMAHVNIAGNADQISASTEFFLDNGVGNPSVTVPTIVPFNAFYRYLSGVKFYTNPSTFRLDAVVSNAFNNTYSANSITFSSVAFGSGTVSYSDVSVTGVTNPPTVGNTMTINDKVITVISGVRDLDATITVTPVKPWATGAPQTSVQQHILVDSTVPSSTDTYEYFVDEVYRLPADDYDVIPADITGQWDSTALLLNGQAEVYNDMLIYPVTNFSSGYLPAQSADYHAFSGNQVYYRAIYHSGYPKSNGLIEFMGLSVSDIEIVGAGNVNVEIKLPTQTGWMDLGKPFDSGTFAGIDGDGCRVSVAGQNWAWTCGTFTTANSGWMYIIRVTLRNSGISIRQMREIGLGWN